MRLSIIALLLLICPTSFGQIRNYQNLVDTALSGLFIFSKPLIINSLDPKEMSEYSENIKESSSQTLDTLMFLDIIHNIKLIDTALWTDNELPLSLLVNYRDETVSRKYALQKFEFTDEKKIKLYKRQINKFNSTEAFERNIFYFSRPIFDNSKSFAIIQWDNGHSDLGGGGGIILYKLQNDNHWRRFGIILNWRY